MAISFQIETKLVLACNTTVTSFQGTALCSVFHEKFYKGTRTEQGTTTPLLQRTAWSRRREYAVHNISLAVVQFDTLSVCFSTTFQTFFSLLLSFTTLFCCIEKLNAPQLYGVAVFRSQKQCMYGTRGISVMAVNISVSFLHADRHVL